MVTQLWDILARDFFPCLLPLLPAVREGVCPDLSSSTPCLGWMTSLHYTWRDTNKLKVLPLLSLVLTLLNFGTILNTKITAPPTPLPSHRGLQWSNNAHGGWPLDGNVKPGMCRGRSPRSALISHYICSVIRSGSPPSPGTRCERRRYWHRGIFQSQRVQSQTNNLFV